MDLVLLAVLALACQAGSGSACTLTDSGRSAAGADAGATDAGATDAGATDAGATDAGATDAGGTASLGPACLTGAASTEVGRLTDANLIEASGLVYSRTRPGVLWSHNDSGSGPVLYAMDTTGAALGTVDVDGADSDDWEDLAAGPFNGVDSLFIGDIGDNGSNRADITVWVVSEPAAGVTAVSARGITLHYPDQPHDAEALLVDPLTGDLYLVTKELAGVGTVYRAAAPLGTDIILEDVATMDLASDPEVMLAMVTGGDVTPDGRCVLLRTYSDLVAWERDPDLPLYTAFSGKTLQLTVEAERQGEAVAAGADSYWTVSEGKAAPVYRYQVAR